MTLNPFEVVDYLSEARDRVTLAFEDQVVFDKYLQTLLLGSAELQRSLKDLAQLRSIDTAAGVQLDILGEIVGQGRTLIDVDIFEFFGFQSVPNAGSFGSMFDPSLGALFYDANNPRYGNIELTDEMYRLLIKAKIAKNITRATPEDVMRFSNFVFNTTYSTIQQEGAAAYTLYIGRQLSAMERSLLTYVDERSEYNSYLLPKPIGVRVSFGQFDATSFFAFSEVPGARGFGRLDSAYYDGTYTYNGVSNMIGALTGSGGKMAKLLSVTTDG